VGEGKRKKKKEIHFYFKKREHDSNPT